MVGWPERRFLDLAGCEHPIVQAPMAAAGGVELCVSVIKGGGLGSLPCGLLTPDQVRAQVSNVRSRAKGPLNLNFFCHEMPANADDRGWRALLQPYCDEYDVEPGTGGALRLPFDADMCAVIEEVRPEVVSFHFGLPEIRLLERVKATGATLVGNATTVEEARWLEAGGVHAIIAQGFEAGGHIGRFLGSDPAEAMGLFALLPQVVDATTVPVIAAGGIADGRGIAAALIGRVFRVLASRGVRELTTEIDVTNAASRGLLEPLGAHVIGEHVEVVRRIDTWRASRSSGATASD